MNLFTRTKRRIYNELDEKFRGEDHCIVMPCHWLGPDVCLYSGPGTADAQK